MDKQELVDLISENGKIHNEFDGFETRQEQIQMLEYVYNSFEDNTNLVCEAGTGVGKSLAYLLPVLYKSKDEPILISTNTKTLQSQLCDKDIPTIQKILGLEDLKITIAKGKGNYVCKRKIFSYLDDLNLFNSEEIRIISNINLDKIKIGEQEEFPDIGFELWGKISADETCTNKRCNYFDECFYHRARRSWWTSNIIICNHYLFACDLAVRIEKVEFEREVVLPACKKLIIDEAHNFEDTVIKSITKSCSKNGVIKFLSTLYSNKNHKGLLVQLSGNIGKFNTTTDIDSIIKSIESLIDTVQRKSKAIEYDFELIYDYAKKRYSKFRLKLQTISEIAFKDFASALNSLYNNLLAIVEDYNAIIGKIRLPSYEEESSDILVSLHKHLTILQKGLENALATLYTFVSYDEAKMIDEVLWVENVKKNTRFNITPLNVSEIFKNFLYPNYNSIIYTSATLATGGSFDYLFTKLGLENGNRNSVMLNSPFNYAENSRIFMPEIQNDPNSQIFPQEISEFIIDTCSYLKGKTFILFTSFSMLDNVYDLIHRRLEGEGVKVLSQSKERRDQILSKFYSLDKCILLGVSTFWEGIDVRGEKLSCIIIPKLPFQVPNDPVVEARIELMNRQGKNSFMEYMLPEAAIRFKQGFGRLIRSKEDRGIVVFLDNRLSKKSYGRYFLRSLPPSPVITSSFENCFQEIQNFFS